MLLSADSLTIIF